MKNKILLLIIFLLFISQDAFCLSLAWYSPDPHSDSSFTAYNNGVKRAATPKYAGTYGCNLYQTASGTGWCYRTIPTQTDGSVQFTGALYVKNSAYGLVAIYTSGGTARIGALHIYASTSKIQYEDSTGNHDLVTGISLSTWYFFTIDINIDTEKIDFDVGGTSVTGKDPVSSFSNVSYINFGTTNSNNYDFCFDAVSAYIQASVSGYAYGTEGVEPTWSSGDEPHYIIFPATDFDFTSSDFWTGTCSSDGTYSQEVDDGTTKLNGIAIDRSGIYGYPISLGEQFVGGN